jgi:uncharacterized protein
MKKVVLDTSVLSAFANIGRLDLLRRILAGNEVIIPDTVYNELIHPQIEEATRKGGWLTVVNAGRLISEPNLDRGELGVIAVAKKLNAVAVLDDKDAREYARKSGIPLTGTLALLKRAKSKGLLEKKQLEEILEDLGVKDSFRITEELKAWTMT